MFNNRLQVIGQKGLALAVCVLMATGFNAMANGSDDSLSKKNHKVSEELRFLDITHDSDGSNPEGVDVGGTSGDGGNSGSEGGNGNNPPSGGFVGKRPISVVDFSFSAKNEAFINHGFLTNQTIETEEGVRYSIGTFKQELKLSDGIQLQSDDIFDVYVLQHDADGALNWARSLPGLGYEHVQMVSFDAFGRLVVAGNFSGTMDFDGQELESKGMSDGFLACFNAFGNVEWLKQVVSARPVEFEELSLDINGDMVFQVQGEYHDSEENGFSFRLDQDGFLVQ